MTAEEPLPGGNVASTVVRVGATVRKPWTAATASVVDFVAALRRAGVDLPEPLGRDAQGRQVQEFVPGIRAIEAPPLSRLDLCRVGRIVRRIHDASMPYTPPADAVWESAIPAPGAELICHNDLAPWNLILGERWVFIDADAAGPSTRVWDLAYAAQAFTLNDPSREPRAAAGDLAALVPAVVALISSMAREQLRARQDLQVMKTSTSSSASAVNPCRSYRRRAALPCRTSRRVTPSNGSARTVRSTALPTPAPWACVAR